MREALRYLNNAKEILKSAPVEDGTYTDVKPVSVCETLTYQNVAAFSHLLVGHRSIVSRSYPLRRW